MSQAVSKRLPCWDIDLGSPQEIVQLSLVVTPGQSLRDVRVIVAKQPFHSGAAPVWSKRLTGPFQTAHLIAIGVTGRYVRVEAVHLPLEGVDVILPQTADMPSAPKLQDILTVTEGGWTTANAAPRRAAQPSQTDGLTLNLSYTAGQTYRVSFDLDGARDGAHLFAWWNGTLVDPAGFAVSKQSRRCSFDVVATGAADQLTFRGAGTSQVPHNVTITPQPKARPKRKWVTRPAPAVQRAANAASGSIAGVLRRSVPSTARSRLTARRASENSAFADEIIFR